MTTTSTDTKRRSIAFAVVALVALAAGAAWLAFGGRAGDSGGEPPPSFVAIERDGYRYEYHLVTGRETLFALKDGKPVLVNVIDEHKDVAAACRASIEKKLGQSLDSARGRYDETIRRLRALGYF